MWCRRRGAVICLRRGDGLVRQRAAAAGDDDPLTTLNRYVNEPIPEVVVVGSSLGVRLAEEYFARPRLRNLALVGGSTVAGLEIVANQPRLPRIILVEVNVLSRPVDEALVETYSRSGNAGSLFFRPIRTAVAAYENWLHAPLTHAQVAFGLNQLLKQPPSDFDSRIYADRALQQFNAEDPTDAVRANAKTIRQLTVAVEQRGARLLLFELPYSEQLEQSRSAKITREIVHAEFPDPDRWLRNDYTRSELRWADGVHLDQRSAVPVTQSIDRALAALLGPT